MELAEYLGSIWRRKWIVLGVTVLAVAINVGVMFVLPRNYVATSVLEVGGIDSYLGNPGTARVDSSGRQTLPSAIQSDTQSYLRLLDTAAVSEEAKHRARQTLALGDIEYSYVSRAEAVRGTGTDVIYIDVAGDNPDVVKASADALAMVLVEQSRELGGDIADSFVKGIQEEQIDPINKRLVEIREESETLKVATGGDTAARNVRIAELEDEAKALDDTRKQYTDIVARVRVNEAMNVNSLRLLSPAATPAAKELPPIARSSAIAAVVGLLIGVMIVLVIERPQYYESDKIF